MIKEYIEEIHEYLQSELYWDAEFHSYSPNENKLVIRISTDFTYYHNLEITFLDVVHFRLTKEWRVDLPALFTSAESFDINGTQFFIFTLSSDDEEQSIAARTFTFSKEIVKYYK